jgi:hypothetical protein
MNDSAGFNNDSQLDPEVYKGGSYVPQYHAAKQHTDRSEVPAGSAAPTDVKAASLAPVEASS